MKNKQTGAEIRLEPNPYQHEKLRAYKSPTRADLRKRNTGPFRIQRCRKYPEYAVSGQGEVYKVKDSQLSSSSGSCTIRITTPQLWVIGQIIKRTVTELAKQTGSRTESLIHEAMSPPYVHLQVNGQDVLEKVSNLVWDSFSHRPVQPGEVVYHLNQNQRDCNFANLRCGTAKQARLWKDQVDVLRAVPDIPHLASIWATKTEYPWFPRAVSQVALDQIQHALGSIQPDSVAHAYGLSVELMMKLLEASRSGSLLTTAEALAEHHRYAVATKCMRACTQANEQGESVPYTTAEITETCGFSISQLEDLMEMAEAYDAGIEVPPKSLDWPLGSQLRNGFKPAIRNPKQPGK